MSNQGLTNIAGIIALADDSWVNGGFEAVVNEVREVKKKDGSGSFFAVKLSDQGGDPTVEMMAFNAPKYATGDRIRVAGQGIKKSSYNGKAQVKVGQKVGVTVVSSGGNSPAAASAPTSGGHAPAAPQAATSIPGVTVGMAVNNALSMLTQGMGHAEIVKATQNAQFWTVAYETASQVIRLSKSLENGKLAPSVWDKAAQTPAPQPPPSNPERELNEDVPF
jgi:hypothetical protein